MFDIGFWILLDTRMWTLYILDTVYWTLDTGYWVADTVGYIWNLDTTYWLLKLHILNTGYWIQDIGKLILLDTDGY